MAARTLCITALLLQWSLRECTAWMGGRASSSTEVTLEVTAEGRTGLFPLGSMVAPRLNTTRYINRKRLALEAYRSISDSEGTFLRLLMFVICAIDKGIEDVSGP